MTPESQILLLPALSPTMQAGKLTRWCVSPGDAVRAGDRLAEIETDKAVMEVEAEAAGFIESLLVSAGSEDVPVGAAIARLTARDPAGRQEATAAPLPTVAPSRFQILKATEPVAALQPSQRVDEPSLASVEPRATALASRIAVASGLQLTTLRGSGLDGRIRLSDLPSAMERPLNALVIGQADPAKRSPLASIPRTETETRQPVRAAEEDGAPSFILSSCLDVGPVLAQVEELNPQLLASGKSLSLEGHLIKAISMAFEKPGGLDAVSGLEQSQRVDVRVTLTAGKHQRFSVVTLKDAGSQPVSHLSRRLLGALEGEVLEAREDHQSCIAEVTFMRAEGLQAVIPCLRPSFRAAFGVGPVEEKAQVRGGVIRPVKTACVSGRFDSRSVEFGDATLLMSDLSRWVAEPFALLIC